MGLPVGAHIPMLGFIGRLDYQKGVDLIHENHGWMMGEGVQLILLGSGRADLEQALRSAHSLLVLTKAILPKSFLSLQWLQCCNSLQCGCIKLIASFGLSHASCAAPLY